MNAEKKKRFNWIDVVIILLVIVLAAVALLVRNKVFNKEEIPTDTMRFTVEARNVFSDFADLCVAGETVYNSSTNAYVGKIVSVSKTLHVPNYNEERAIKIAYDGDDSYDIIITIEGQGYVNGRDIVIGGYTPKVGAAFYLKGKGFASATFVVDIDTMNAKCDPLVNDSEGELGFTYQIANIGVRQAGIDAIHIGDILYDELNDVILGEVVDKKVMPVKNKEDENKDTGYFTQIITLKAKGTETDKGYFINGTYELKVGAGNADETEKGYKFVSRYAKSTYWFYSLLDIQR